MRALTQITAERGYAEVKVRDVVKLAGVSTRSFYEHFTSKEDCFVRTYEQITRQATRRIIASQAGEADWRMRPGEVFDAFVRDVTADADAARLVLIEAYRAGPSVLEHAWRAERAFDAMVVESLARQPDGVDVPPAVVEGMIAGIAYVTRARLASGRSQDLISQRAELMAWVLCFPHQVTSSLLELDVRSVRDSNPLPAKARVRPSGDRALIIAAVAKLVASGAHDCLTVPRIRSAAGISRRKFDSHFSGVEDCFVATLDLHASEALAKSAAAQTAARSWPGGIYRAIDALCEHISEDAFLAAVCASDDLVPNSHAARCKSNLAAAAIEQLQHSVPKTHRRSDLMTEASIGALWTLFQRYVTPAISPLRPRLEVAPTLSYMALAPAIGPSAAIQAIRNEQDA